METIRIFISSPNDVAEERNKARQAIASLSAYYGSEVTLLPVLWEDLAIPATASFQEGIDHVLSTTHQVHVAVFILWSRLGSELSSAIAKPDGSPFRSGTEREFHLMLEAFAQSGKKRPVILAYTRLDEKGFRQSLAAADKDKWEEMLRQHKLVDEFVSESFHDDQGRNLRAYHSFGEPVGFATRLNTHLRQVLDEMLATSCSRVRWNERPYRGLEAFDVQHAPIFSGREEESCDVIQQLRERQAVGCASVVIVGASGSGKSSLARAGVAASLLERSFDDDVRQWRLVVLVPGVCGDDVLGGLAAALAAGVPELRSGPGGEERFAARLRDNLEAARDLLEAAFATASREAGGSVRVLLLVDQMEELWSDRRINHDSGTNKTHPGGSEVQDDDGIDAASGDGRVGPCQLENVLSALEALARSGHVAVLSTLRSDFYQQAQLSPSFLRLKEGAGHYDLTPPGPAALHRLITEPARLAGFTFQRDERTGRTLDRQILDDAAGNSDALPLVEFTLDELVKAAGERRELTWASYTDLGGVQGALARRADAVLANLSLDAQNALDPLLKALVALGGEDGVTVTRVRALQSELEVHPPTKKLMDALVRERLLVAGHDAVGAATVVLAHEALLRGWNRVTGWINVNQRFLLAQRQLNADLNIWKQGGRRRGLLLPRGMRLKSARQLLKQSRSALNTEQRKFIRASVANARWSSTWHQIIFWLCVAGVLVLTIAGLTVGGVYVYLNDPAVPEDWKKYLKTVGPAYFEHLRNGESFNMTETSAPQVQAALEAAAEFGGRKKNHPFAGLDRFIATEFFTFLADHHQPLVADSRIWELVTSMEGNPFVDWANDKEAEGRDAAYAIARVALVSGRSDLVDGLLATALDHGERQLEKDPADRKARDLCVEIAKVLADFRLAEHRPAEAWDAAQKMLRIQYVEAPPDPESKAARALWLLKCSRPAEALPLAEEMAGAGKDASRGILYRAWALELLGRAADAAAVRQSLAEITTEKPAMLATAVYEVVAEGDRAGGAAAMGLLVERFATDPAVHAMAGWSFINMGENEKALAAFHRAQNMVKSRPGSSLLRGLAVAKWLTGDQDGAVADYKQLAEMPSKENWLSAETIARLSWSDAEKRPLEAVRAATVATYSDLKPNIIQR